LSGQSEKTETYVFVDQTPYMILKTIESQSDFKFNFISDNLPQRTFTCSIDKEEDLMLKGLSVLLKRSIKQLSKGVFTVGSAANKNIESEENVIESQIIDYESGLSIIGATLMIPSVDYGVVSDADGVVRIQGFFAENDIVEINYLGYETQKMKLSQFRKLKTIVIQAKEHVLDDIVIKSYKKLSTTHLTGDVIDPETINLPSAPDKDAFSQAQMIPGVYNSSESLQDLQIRGGPPDQVSYNWNNMRLFQNSLFYGRVSSVNPFMVDQINVTRNGASADEDASASGAINLKTDLSNIDTTSLFAHINGLFGNVGLQTSLFSDVFKIKGAYRKSLSGFLQTDIYDKYFDNVFQFGRVPDLDYYHELFEVEDKITKIPSFEFQDLSLSTQIELGKDSYIRGNMIRFGNKFTYNQIKDYSPELELDSLTISTNGYSFEWQQQITKSLSTTVNYGSSDYSYYYIITDDKRNIQNSFLTQTNTVDQNDMKFKLNWAKRHYTVTAGYDYYNWHVIYEALSSRPWEDWFEAREDAKGKEHSGYLNLQINTHPWYRVLLGLRGSSYNLAIFGRNIYEPRLHASIFANDKLTIHAHYGKFHQNLNRRNFNTNLRADNGFWLLSNEGVTSSNFIHIVQSSQISAGLKYSSGDWTFTGDVYKKQSNNIWTSAFDFPSDEDLYEFTRLNIIGLELSAQFQNDWLSLMWTYDHIDDKIITRETDLEINSPFTQPHRLSMYQSVRKGPWSISLQIVYATGRFFSTPTSLGLFEKENELYYDPIYDSYLDQRVSDYFKVDLGGGYRYKFGRRYKKYLDFKIQILNALNRDNIIKNEFYVDYRQDPPELSLYRKRGLPFIVNFSIELRI